MRVLVHGFRGGQRSLLAEVDEGGVAVVGAQQQKSSAAQVSGCGMYYRQRKSCGHGRIHGVAALAQHFTPASEARWCTLTTIPWIARAGCSSR
jgi:hypothetical protein